MKKIMKKALSLVVVLVMVLSLAPMTAMAAQGDSADEPYMLTSTTATVTVQGGESALYCAYETVGGPNSYALKVTGDTGFMVQALYNGMPGGPAIADTNGTVSTTVDRAGFSMVGTYSFRIVNTNAEAKDYTVELSVPLGSEDNPDTLEVGTTVAPVTGSNYFYAYEVPADGKLTVTMGDETVNESGWIYNILDSTMYPLIDMERWSNDAEFGYDYVPSETVEVAEGDVVYVYVCTVDWSVGEVEFTAYFEADEKAESNAYADEYAAIVEGENELVQDGTVYRTVYEFAPGKLGVYTITAGDGYVVYNYGGNANFLLESAEAVESFEVTISDVAQSYYIAVACEEADTWAPTAEVTVTWEELEEEPEVVWTDYENTADLEKYTLEGTAVEFDVADGVVEGIAKGDDGYYYTTDGKLVVVNLKSTMLSLADAVGYGSVKVQNAELAGTDYTAAIMEYVAVMDESGYYPLTDDLIEIYKEVGADRGWYDIDGDGFYLFINPADGEPYECDENAWMFACAYVEPATEEGPGNTPEGSKPVPDTSDSSNVALWVTVLGLGVVAIAGSVVMKKREF